MEDSIKSQSQAVYQADGANTFAGLDKVYGLMQQARCCREIGQNIIAPNQASW